MSDNFALKYMMLKLFGYSIGIFFFAFVIWKILVPVQYPMTDENFTFGVFLFFFFSLFSILAWVTKSRSCLGPIFFWPASLFWLILFLFMINSYPSVRAISYKYGTVYILTHYQDFLEPQYYGFQVTKWSWGVLPETSWLSERNGDVQFVYDEEKKSMMVVSTFRRGGELLYIDNGTSHQDFQGYTGTEFENHIYFVSMNCNWDKTSSSCDPSTYSIAKCNLDLTTCENLPFQYQDRYAYPYLEVDKENNELDFILEFADPPYGLGERTLSEVKIYTYGAHPRCYVEGCKILKTP